MTSRTRLRHWLSLLVLVIVASVASGTVGQAASAAVSTSTVIDGTKSGRVFDGIGAASGGGGNSRLLIDYPEPQRGQILDYLFKPGYGANLQLLKIEVGGDTNSTDGAEPSFEHTRGTENCDAGYEFWIAEQAKARNPNIKLLGLAWGAPGWVGNGSFWTQDMIDYYTDWLGCAKQHGLTFDYLGGWNEKGSNRTFFLNLSSALQSKFPSTKVIADDTNISYADKLVNDPTYAAAISVVGTHYPCGWLKPSLTCASSANALATGKPLWASEGGSQDMTTGNGALIRQFTRGYLDAKYTALIHWPLAAALTPNLPFPTDGLVSAQSPWSGNYSVGNTAWTLAQITQFTAPGWSFIDSAGGYLGGDRTNGSFVSLKAPDRSAYSTIIETSTATAAQTFTFSVTGGLPAAAVHVWSSNLNSAAGADQFVHEADITASGGHYSITLQPGRIYTLSTISKAAKGTAAGPASHALALPYADNFDSYAVNSEATYLSDMQGAYEVRTCAAGRSGRCVQQVAPVKPIEWQADSDAFALVGDPTWRNYTVSADVDLQQAGSAELYGRAGTQGRPQSSQSGYRVQLNDKGAWSILKTSTSGTVNTLTSGTTTAPGLNKWLNLSLTMNGSTISAAVDGKSLGSVTDSAYTAGQVGIGVAGYQTDQFDNLSVTAVGGSGSGGGGPVTSALGGKCLENAGGSAADGNEATSTDCDGGAAQRWTYSSSDQSLRSSAGSCLDVTARGTVNGTLVETWTCNGASNQKWQPGTGDTLVNPASGRCLDVPKSSRTNGTQLDIWDCNGNSNQQWTLS